MGGAPIPTPCSSMGRPHYAHNADTTWAPRPHVSGAPGGEGPRLPHLVLSLLLLLLSLLGRWKGAERVRICFVHADASTCDHVVHEAHRPSQFLHPAAQPTTRANDVCRRPSSHVHVRTNSIHRRHHVRTRARSQASGVRLHWTIRHVVRSQRRDARGAMEEDACEPARGKGSNDVDAHEANEDGAVDEGWRGWCEAVKEEERRFRKMFGRRMRKGRSAWWTVKKRIPQPPAVFWGFVLRPHAYHTSTKQAVTYWVAMFFLAGSILFVIGAAASLKDNPSTTFFNWMVRKLLRPRAQSFPTQCKRSSG